ncbi:MAG: TrbC/VirB2 family protein [Candidatus Altiarchaeota archaeon]
MRTMYLEVKKLDKKIVVGMLFMLVLSSTVAANSTYVQQAEDKICNVLQNIYELIVYIAGGIGALVIVIQGVTWVASADDANARKNAKTAVIHVIIGLIIISLALVLVAMVLPEGADCVTGWPGWPS